MGTTRPKVFGIGLHKTGTSTLRECLRILGYNVCPEPEGHRCIRDVMRKEYGTTIALAQQYDAFEDTPWNFAKMYQRLSNTFPTAQFVLTVRDPERWYASLMRWVNKYNNARDPGFVGALGMPVVAARRNKLLTAYQRHNKNVIRYFRKSTQLLVLDWEQGDGWAKLCQFLALPAPDCPLPHMLRYDAQQDTYVDNFGDKPAQIYPGIRWQT
jgi:hypothetical protein